MGTHANIYILDENYKPLVNIYSHYDGYPEGRGQDLYDLLAYRWKYDCMDIAREDEWKYTSNGMEDLAALVVWYLKNENKSYNIYLEKTQPDFMEIESLKRSEFTYVIYDNREAHPDLSDKNDNFDKDLRIVVFNFENKIYAGSISEMADALSLEKGHEVANDAQYNADRLHYKENKRQELINDPNRTLKDWIKINPSLLRFLNAEDQTQELCDLAVKLDKTASQYIINNFDVSHIKM